MEWSIQEELLFREEAFVVSLQLSDEEQFTVEVQSSDTADQWRATFEKEYIEELTHKTGNFKQFDIFANMLENAITDGSDAVSLELLTYNDLEALRSQKGGNTSYNGQGKSELTSKRYLILIYSVEFDRIHYPLPLPYVGKPDPVALQNEIRELKAKLSESVSMQSEKPTDKQKSIMRKLKEEANKLSQEKQEILYEFELYKKEVKDSTKTSVVAKEMKVLKGVIKNLEAELLREKSKHQKAINKLNQEYNQLLDEVEETKSNERSLRTRVKSLSAELNILKKGPHSNRPTRINSPKLSPRVPKNTSNSVHQSVSSVNYLNGTSANHSNRSNRSDDSIRSRQRKRSNSIEDVRGIIGPSGRSRSREPVAGRSNIVSRSRSQSPSGSVSSRNRFDPTSYIKEKAMKEKENQLRRSLEKLPQNRRRTSDNGSQRGRSNSYDRNKTSQGRVNRVNDFTSGDESDASSIGSRRSRISTSGRIFTKKNALNTSNGSARSNIGSSRHERALTDRNQVSHHISPRDLTATAVRSLQNGDRSDSVNVDVLNQSTDLEDIDARLNALQEFMKLNL